MIISEDSCLTVFGEGHDLIILDNCNVTMDSCSNFGDTFDCSPLTFGSDKACCYLAGGEYFSVLEIEVYKVLS